MDVADKVESSQVEAVDVEEKPHHRADLINHGFSTDLEELPKGYYTSAYFLGTMFAVGVCIMSGLRGFSLIVPVLGRVNADIGPSANITWVAPFIHALSSRGTYLVGRLSDIFGRRWFFVAGSGLGLIGSIIASTAHSVPQVIVGEALIGLAAAPAYSFTFTLGELVPMKYCFAANSVIYVFTYPVSGFGPVISNAVILHAKASWRWIYYILIILNAISMICWILFYHPPYVSYETWQYE
jgi:MFS family permease